MFCIHPSNTHTAQKIEIKYAIIRIVRTSTKTDRVLCYERKTSSRKTQRSNSRNCDRNLYFITECAIIRILEFLRERVCVEVPGTLSYENSSRVVRDNFFIANFFRGAPTQQFFGAVLLFIFRLEKCFQSAVGFRFMCDGDSTFFAVMGCFIFLLRCVCC